MRPAEAICPGWGRSRWMSSRKGRALPIMASMVMAQAVSAAMRSWRASCKDSAPMAAMPSVPLSSERPSFAWSERGMRSVSLAGTIAPSILTLPSPMRGNAMWANGARSPDAPTEPRDGMTGRMSRSSISRIRSTTTGRTPEWPWARVLARSKRIARTNGSGRGAPTPEACERMRLYWRVSASSRSIRVEARAPNPVVIP